MKEIKVVDQFKNHAILEEGTIEGIDYKICFLRGGYYTCYLDVSNTDLAGIDYMSIDLDVWWGLTYGADHYPWERDTHSEIKDNKWIIGWDYGHCDDAVDVELHEQLYDTPLYAVHDIESVHHTQLELYYQCASAIYQIIAKGKELIQ